MAPLVAAVDPMIQSALAPTTEAFQIIGKSLAASESREKNQLAMVKDQYTNKHELDMTLALGGMNPENLQTILKNSGAMATLFRRNTGGSSGGGGNEQH